MEESNQEIEIPCHFQCPISMQLMRDPVTVSTGITYDRENIEKWLFSCKNTTCPVTKQSLSDTDLTPNHTLRRLIQSWCTLNAFDRIPTPKPSVDKAQILKLLKQAMNSPKHELSRNLHKLRWIAHRNISARIHLKSAVAVDFLLSIVRKNDDAIARDEALNILHLIELSDSDLKKFFVENESILDSLIAVMDNGSCQNRGHAITLLKSAFNVADPAHVIGSKPELYIQIVHVLRDKISPQATKTALKLLVEICPWGRNRIKAVENGAIWAIMEILLESSDRRVCELALTTLDQMCGCADGRAELLRHGAGLAIVSKKILRVSNTASDRAVRILGSISRYSAGPRVLQEMLQVGVVSKLCLVLQAQASKKSKERAKEILRMHAGVWRDSSCIPSHLLSSYPPP